MFVHDCETLGHQLLPEWRRLHIQISRAKERLAAGLDHNLNRHVDWSVGSYVQIEIDIEAKESSHKETRLEIQQHS